MMRPRKVGDRVIEDYDVGDREPRTGTVRRITPGHRGERDWYIEWDDEAWPKVTIVPVAGLKRLST